MWIIARRRLRSAGGVGGCRRRPHATSTTAATPTTAPNRIPVIATNGLAGVWVPGATGRETESSGPTTGEGLRRLPVLVMALLIGAALAACGGGSTRVATGGGAPTTAPPAPSGGAPPTAPRIVLRIRTGGGLVPREREFTTLPQLTLYADGRIIQTGASVAVYPGPALPSLFSGTVPDGGVRAAVAAAKEAGITEDPDLGRPATTDRPTTTFVLVDEGRTYRVAAYALGVDNADGLSAVQRKYRERLEDLQRQMEELAAATHLEPYQAEAVSVLARPYPASGPVGPEHLAPDQAEWPLSPLTTLGQSSGARCLGFTGAEAERVLAAAREAKSNTRWHSGGMTWALSFRPELPGIAPCSDP